MTITLDPETEKALLEQARVSGMDITEYLRSLSKQASGKIAPADTTWEEFQRDWNAFCEPIPGLPPNVDLSREAMYYDHPK